MTQAADPDGPDGEVFAVITGGGTGGHVYPALALADALVARGHPRDTIRFVGARRGLEARVVPEAGYAIDLLPVSGIPLPFISFGGSALVFTMVAAGILGNVARQAR